MIRKLIILITITIAFTACHHIEEWDNDAKGNFDALWTVIDEHYCFFKEKNIDWDAVYKKYNSRVYDGMSSQMLFSICADMVNELQDGHVNLASWFDTSYYRNWWSDYPQNFNDRLIEQYYFKFDNKTLGGLQYTILNENVGYMRYSSFTSGIGESNLDAILNEFVLCTGMIIDIRDNGGGNLTNVETLVRRFIRKRTLAGYMVNKTGPGHNDFSKPEPYYFDPIDGGHLMWDKPVVVLTNRSTFSAANNFASIMQYLPNVKIVGATSGGGSGIPISLEIPCGWTIRMSAVSVLDAKGLTTEFGVQPSEGCAVDLDPILALSGIDTMIEKAIEIIINK